MARENWHVVAHVDQNVSLMLWVLLLWDYTLPVKFQLEKLATKVDYDKLKKASDVVPSALVIMPQQTHEP
jgi:hypothetical protein